MPQTMKSQRCAMMLNRDVSRRITALYTAGTTPSDTRRSMPWPTQCHPRTTTPITPGPRTLPIMVGRTPTTRSAISLPPPTTNENYPTEVPPCPRHGSTGDLRRYSTAKRCHYKPVLKCLPICKFGFMLGR